MTLDLDEIARLAREATPEADPGAALKGEESMDLTKRLMEQNRHLKRVIARMADSAGLTVSDTTLTIERGDGELRFRIYVCAPQLNDKELLDGLWALLRGELVGVGIIPTRVEFKGDSP